MIESLLLKDRVLTEKSSFSRELLDSSFGVSRDGAVELSLLEALYLVEKKRLVVLDGKNKPLSASRLRAVGVRREQDFFVRYAVFADLRSRGYVVVSGLKFGADFRVYDRGVKPGSDHARWVVFACRESEKLTWQGFSAKARVAHGTKKRLLIAVVDDEGAVSYWEFGWLRP